MEIQVHEGDTLTFGNTKYVARCGRLICVSERMRNKDAIIEAVCKAYGYSLNQLYPDERERRKVDARRALCYFLNRYSRLTTLAIGTTIHRNHATVLHHIHSWQELMPIERDIRLMDEKIREILFEN